MPAGNEVVVMASGTGAGLTTIDRFAVFDWAGVELSVTLTVKLAVPAAVGVPLIRPVAPFTLSPAGKFPELTVQAYGGDPPLAASDWE